LRAANADVVVVGHTHRAMELRLGDRLVLNTGALLRDPSDGWERELPTPGTFGVLELPVKAWTVIDSRTGHPVEIVRVDRLR
jgi:predicted phosphodiesterase